MKNLEDVARVLDEEARLMCIFLSELLRDEKFQEKFKQLMESKTKK